MEIVSQISLLYLCSHSRCGLLSAALLVRLSGFLGEQLSSGIKFSDAEFWFPIEMDSKKKKERHFKVSTTSEFSEHKYEHISVAFLQFL